MSDLIRIGTRASKLALWQAHKVEKALQEAGLATQIVTFETIGDKVQDRSLAKIGSKGVFTEELEAQLLNGELEVAVHSAKDLQSQLLKGLEIAAFMEREKPNDVLVSYDRALRLESDIVVGTSSTRRNAQLRKYAPHVRTVDMRGNLQTRLAKLKEGQCDALLLAYAGVHRMGYGELIVEELLLDRYIPAVGQGAIAVEVAATLNPKISAAIRRACNHVNTETCLKAERSFLRVMEGGCSIPVFGLAELRGSNLSMTAGIISLDGSRIVREHLEGDPASPDALGTKMAELVLGNGGREILAEIRVALA